MKDLLMMAAIVILAVFLINTFISGGSNTLKSESNRIGNNMITNTKEIEKNATVYTP